MRDGRRRWRARPVRRARRGARWTATTAPTKRSALRRRARTVNRVGSLLSCRRMGTARSVLPGARPSIIHVKCSRRDPEAAMTPRRRQALCAEGGACRCRKTVPGFSSPRPRRGQAAAPRARDARPFGCHKSGTGSTSVVHRGPRRPACAVHTPRRPPSKSSADQRLAPMMRARASGARPPPPAMRARRIASGRDPPVLSLPAIADASASARMLEDAFARVGHCRASPPSLQPRPRRPRLPGCPRGPSRGGRAGARPGRNAAGALCV